MSGKETPAKAVDYPALVERWFQDNFPNSPVSWNVDCWNLVFTAKERLKEILAKGGE